MFSCLQFLRFTQYYYNENFQFYTNLYARHYNRLLAHHDLKIKLPRAIIGLCYSESTVIVELYVQLRLRPSPIVRFVTQKYNGFCACIALSYPGHVGGERRPSIDCLCIRDHIPETLESVFVWNLLVKSICIYPIYFCIIERYSHLPVELPSTHKSRV